MAFQVRRIDQIAHCLERRAEWQRFVGSCSLASPFCRAEVWLAWYEAFPEFRPLVYELREDERLVALLPLYRQGPNLHLATECHLDYQDIAADSDAAACALVQAIIEREGAAGLSLTFGKVAEHSRLFSLLSDPRIASLASVQRRYWSVCPHTGFRLPEPGVLAGALTARQRKDYNNATRRVREAMPDHVIEHRLGSAISSEAIEAAAELHRSSQCRKKGQSVFSDPGFSEFLLRQAATDEPLMLCLLRERAGGPVVAFNLGYFTGDTYYYYLTAYDAGHAALSPGRKLLIDTLSHCAERMEGDHLRFDLLSGEESYKSRWATSFYEVWRFQIIPRRLANLPKMAAYRTVYGLKGAKNWCRERLSVGESLAALEHERPALIS